MDAIYESLSCGRSGVSREVLDVISGTSGRTVLRRALSVDGDWLGECAPGLANRLQIWSEDAASVLWRREIGRIERALAPKHRIAPYLELGLSLSVDGIEGDWRFNLNEPIRLGFGAWISPNVSGGTIRIYPTGSEIILFCADGPIECRLARSDSCNRAVSPLLRQLTVAGSDGYYLPILPGEMVDPAIIPAHVGVGFQNRYTAPQFGAVLTETLDLLKSMSPAYYDWVSAVVRYVTPLRAPARYLSSSSSPWEWGLVALTQTRRLLAVAEMLVHEASHQIFFLAKRLGRIDDGSDQTLYYSPMARQPRQVERILLAYHALGNIALMYADLAARGGDHADDCVEQIRRATPKLLEMEAILSASSALTSLGASLYHGLHSAVLHSRFDWNEGVNYAPKESTASASAEGEAY